MNHQSDLRDEISATARQLLSDRFPVGRLLAGDTRPTGAEWNEFATLGWFGLGIPQMYGGVGCSAAEETVLFEEVGRALLPGPVLGTVIAAHLAAQLDDTELCAALLTGDVTAGISLGSAARRRHVVGLAPDGHLLVLGECCALIHRDALHDVRRIDGVDPTSSLHIVDIDARPEHVLAELTGASARALTARAVVLVAAMQSGIASATLERSVEYAVERRQFGRPIGAFQAVKHRCADMAVRARAATTLTRHVAGRLDTPESISLATAATAKCIADESARLNSAATIQNLGGTGYTWDQGIHLYVNRQAVQQRLAISAHDAVILVAGAASAQVG